ncbi:hypothetical protein HRbin29_02350 [bacterium HR29]|jgi:hypothetical protein|nr:hypothetical protein HRbin29_02350 [bacterium HR29]
MTTPAAAADFIEEGGVLVGPWREPRNEAADQRGSIHDDETARRLGFRGGTVAGSIHLEQFPPSFLRLWGPRWFERGSISAYFRNATTDREAVRTYVRIPDRTDDVQTEIWMEDREGRQVLEGTASVGDPGAPTRLAQLLASQRTGGDVRILGHLAPGTELPPVPTRLPLEAGEQRMRVITEPLPWYATESPWGGPIATPALVVRAMRPVEQGMDLRRHRAVGLFGAIELRFLAGPVFLGRDYQVRGRLVAIGETPKSEFAWYEAVLFEPESGRDVAAMLMMLRFMKASSPLWQDHA